MNNINAIAKLNSNELSKDIKDSASWHDDFKDSAWVYVGGLDFTLTEGDVLTILSQYGEIVDVKLIRDKDTGKSKGFAFVAYEDQKSTILAVDNLNGIKIANRTICINHHREKPRKYKDDEDPEEIARQDDLRRLNVLPPHLRPKGMDNDSDSSSEEEEAAEDLLDPMRNFIKAKKEKKSKKSDKKSKKEKRRKAKDHHNVDDVMKDESDVLHNKEISKFSEERQGRERDVSGDRNRDISRYREEENRSRHRDRSREREQSSERNRNRSRDCDEKSNDRNRSRDRSNGRDTRSRSRDRRRDRSNERDTRSRSRDRRRRERSNENNRRRSSSPYSRNH